MLVAQDVGNQISLSPAWLGAWFSAALQLVGHPPLEWDRTCSYSPPPCPSVLCAFSAQQRWEALVVEMTEAGGEEQEEKT